MLILLINDSKNAFNVLTVMVWQQKKDIKYVKKTESWYIGGDDLTKALSSS